MIKINLSSRAKNKFDLGNVAGFNLRLVNVKMLIVIFIVNFIGMYFLEDFISTELNSLNSERTQLQSENRKLSKQEKGLKNIETQIEALNFQD